MLVSVEHFLALSADDLVAERPEAADEDDVHFPEALVEAIVGEYSSAGDTVLDPFAGYGTTLVVAERMGRRVVGVELLAERVRFIRARVSEAARVIEGDARRLDGYGVGPVDLCLTSPPYMDAVDHPENPLTAYTTLDGHYRTYLAELGGVFAAVARLLTPGGHLVVNAANLIAGGTVTPLAWDIARAIGRTLTFRGEIYLRWDRPPADITGDYCLVFRKT
jgi:DNA modification methylase